MPEFSSCVIDTSVIIKALFSPSRKNAGVTYSRELKTHHSCIALLAALDDHGIEVILPRCGLIEIAAVSIRLSNSHNSKDICNEVENSYTLVPEDRVYETAMTIALDEGCPGFDTYFLALAELKSVPLFTDDAGMFRICQRRSIAAWLIRDLDPESLFTR
ncbi:type II toxin-antitoxin system VapC family toxin [Methanoregula formicica]|jgi:predicted nucleic acid-binding protein|uniref:Putative nucleic acid-binding protein, contains PIN domain n=1 Tax=Methanoregula formicica (strain DSM 22288 / NBRC 105244 / SMSP) TaxID=593750 RepID=L0HFN0_METFS|nr:type II toxin-antitoxin system VapC family toxin [Methanoregula formicica]AGB02810.1 putative nucleic acid-binding protein, contains PIN domain [Methanoregula formicica SMSP]